MGGLLVALMRERMGRMPVVGGGKRGGTGVVRRHIRVSLLRGAVLRGLPDFLLGGATGGEKC